MSSSNIENFQKYMRGELVIESELLEGFWNGSIDYDSANSLVDSTVKIVDDAILRMKSDG